MIKPIRHFLLTLSLTVSLPDLSLAMDGADNQAHGPAARHCVHCSGLRQECLVPRAGGGGSTGKWRDAVTPKRGWRCTGATDLGPGKDNLEQCEMCESEKVRYMHHMVHGNQNPLTLRVGCICSGHMTGEFNDLASIQAAVAQAQRRTNDLENRATRRTKFPTLAGWKISQKGNTYINTRDKNYILITEGEGRYSVKINEQWLPTRFRNMREAKLGAFDKLYPPTVH